MDQSSSSRRLAEVTMEIVERPRPDAFYRNRSLWTDWKNVMDVGDVSLLRIAGDRSVVEVTYTDSTDDAKEWIRTVLRDHRRRRGPSVAGLCIFRGSPFSSCYRRHKPPSGAKRPIRAFALCLGGSHVLLLHGRELEVLDGVPKLPGPIADFLGDGRNAVCSFGAASVAKQLAEEWGLHVARPVDLSKLAVEAYGKEADVVVDKESTKHVHVSRLGLEGLAVMALGKEMRVGKWPQSLVDGSPWSSFECTKEVAMYAARDAFLCFEIGLKCFSSR